LKTILYVDLTLLRYLSILKKLFSKTYTANIGRRKRKRGDNTVLLIKNVFVAVSPISGEKEIMTKCVTHHCHHQNHQNHHHQQQQQQQKQRRQSSCEDDAVDEDADSRRKSLVAIVHRFGGKTSMHGVPNAIRAHSMTGRVFWCIVCITAACIFGFQLTQLLRKYFSYPRKVVIEVLPLAAPFPSISLCNMRNLDTIVLNRLNRIFLQTNDIGATLRQFTGDASSPPNVSESPPVTSATADDDAAVNDTHRRRRSSTYSDSSADDAATAVTNDDWLRLMESVLWKSRGRRRKHTESAGFKKRTSFSTTSSGKRASTSRKRRDEGTNKRRTRQSTDYDDAEYEDYDDADYIDAALLNDPVNEFIRSYMRAVAKYWPMFEMKDSEMRHVFQSVLTRTTIASNMNRTTLTNAGVPFKEFVVTCRYRIFYAVSQTRATLFFYDNTNKICSTTAISAEPLFIITAFNFFFCLAQLSWEWVKP